MSSKLTPVGDHLHLSVNGEKGREHFLFTPHELAVARERGQKYPLARPRLPRLLRRARGFLLMCFARALL